MTQFTARQYDSLIRPIFKGRIQILNNQSHLEAWDVRRHLIRIFGFDGFDIETKALDLVREIEHQPGTIKTTKWVEGNRTEVPNAETRWTVIYRAEVRLIIKVNGRSVAVFEDGAAGDSQNQPSLGDAHDHAMKTALSQALKRCAVNLGDQFGLSLYNGGRPDPVVVRTAVEPVNGSANGPVEELPSDVAPEPGPMTYRVVPPEPGAPQGEQADYELSRG